jgi:hypothetical protein
VIVLGGSLAGLRAASVLVSGGYKVTVLERAPMAGGCTSSWVDHRDPEKGMIRKGQMQMNFPFYVNLNEWVKSFDAYSGPLDGFYFHDQYGRSSHLTATPQSIVGRWLSKLPAPFSALQILWDFDGLPRLRDKLSTFKFHVLAMFFGQKAVPPINDDWNFYGLMKYMGLTHEAVEAYRRITYSITNIADADQVGPKFMHLFYLTYLRDKNALGCRMMTDDCNVALVDKVVAFLRARGVEFRCNCHVRGISVEKDRVVSLLVEDFSNFSNNVCPHCGLLFPALGPEASCPACGNTFNTPVRYPNCGARDRLEADYIVSALQPHQLFKIYEKQDNHPLRQYPEFRALAQFKGAQLTVSRVFMDAKITEGYNLTGLDRDFFSFNGAMDISHVMPKYQHSVFDTLSDDAEVLQCYPPETLKARLRQDLQKIFPAMAGAKVTKHLMAHIKPEVLYHRPVTRLNSRFLPNGPVTPVSNLFLAGDWTDELELGKEAAVKSGVRAANAVLAADGRSTDEAEPILQPSVAPLVRLVQNNPVSRFIARRYEKIYRKEFPPKRG